MIQREAFDSAGDLKPYTIAKHYSDDYLNSGLNYTIVHPGDLLMMKVLVKLKQIYDKRASIPRDDVATVLKSSYIR